MSITEADTKYSSEIHTGNSRPSRRQKPNVHQRTTASHILGMEAKHAENMEVKGKQVSANTKKCSRCGQIKCVDYFGHHPRLQDGYLSECKTCRGSKESISDKSIESEVKAILDAIPHPVNSNTQFVETLTDKVLADELRRRGYDVKATKTIEI